MKFIPFKRYLNWKKNLERLSDKELLELYSETNRINLEPQIYAGQILIRRSYNNVELKRIKEKLIQSIKEQCENKYGKNESEIKRENTFRLIFFRIISGAGLFLGLKALINLGQLFPNLEFRELLPYIGLIISFTPLLNLKKLNQAEIKRVNMKKLQAEESINKINKDLEIK